MHPENVKKIAVVEGDGISPPIIAEAKKILELISNKTSLEFEFVDAPAGGNVYKKVGTSLPDKSLRVMENSDAILFGAVGLPDLPQGVAEYAILKIRQHFDQYINLRPIKLFNSARDTCPLKDRYIGKGIDMVFIRENSEGLYAKIGGIIRNDEVATNLMVYTKKGVDRIIRYAFELTRKHPRFKKVTSVDKANILACSQLWRRRFEEIAKDYPEIKTENFYVDAFCQWLIRKPYECEVVVTGNLFGDIISDEAAYLLGSLGMAPGGNICPGGISMYEPIHGSAPDIAGKGIANPIGTILAAKLMITESFYEHDIGLMIEKAVEEALEEGRTTDIQKDGLATLTTKEMGDLITSKLEKILKN
ncbi:MAG: isocitrate/isopropylmalate dehydrogenase family protein [Promethearchaeota archaeon]